MNFKIPSSIITFILILTVFSHLIEGTYHSGLSDRNIALPSKYVRQFTRNPNLSVAGAVGADRALSLMLQKQLRNQRMRKLAQMQKKLSYRRRNYVLKNLMKKTKVEEI